MSRNLSRDILFVCREILFICREILFVCRDILFVCREIFFVGRDFLFHLSRFFISYVEKFFVGREFFCYRLSIPESPARLKEFARMRILALVIIKMEDELRMFFTNMDKCIKRVTSTNYDGNILEINQRHLE